MPRITVAVGASVLLDEQVQGIDLEDEYSAVDFLERLGDVPTHVVNG